MNFLIVDDSPTVRLMLRRVLTNIYPDCKVIDAKNGKDAFSALKTEGFNLIITDLNMEDGDGDAFIYKLKSNKILAKKKILVLTSTPEKIAGKFDATVHILNKNTPQEKLIETIKEILKKR